MPARYRLPVLVTCLFLSLLSHPFHGRAAALMVAPASASISSGQSMWFTTSVSGSLCNSAGLCYQGVSWSESPVIGTIINGYYTAPSAISAAQTVTLTATSLHDTTISATAVVSLVPAGGGSTTGVASTAIQLSPASTTLAPGQSAQFTPSLVGGGAASVSWSLTPNIGTIANGLYTAPATVSTQTIVTLTAANVTSPSSTASASITLQASPTPTTPTTPTTGAISLTPALSSLAAGQTIALTSNASGSALCNSAGLCYQGVSWSITPAVGTITNGYYTAPSTITSSQTVTVIATSLQVPSISGTAIVTLAPGSTGSTTGGSTTGSSTTGSASTAIQLSPTSTTLSPGQTAQFTPSLVSGGAASVSWSLTPSVGTVVNGLYTAPATVSAATTVTVLATNLLSPSSTASASISLLASPSSGTSSTASTTGTISMTPLSTSLTGGQSVWFTTGVSGPALCNSAGLCYQGVSWSITPAVGTITNGYYVAPTTITSSQTVTVTATSLHAPSISANALISLVASSAPQPAPSLQLSPASSTLAPGQSAQFTLMENGGRAASNAVWSLVPNVGSVTSGVYTAPSSMSTQTTVTLMATTTDVPGVTASASIVLQPNPVSVSLSPSSASLSTSQSAQFAAVVSGSSNTGVSWSVTPAIGTVTNGVYTAPATVTTQQIVTVTATSLADPTKSASAVITLAPISISLVPTSIALNASASSQFTATVTGTTNTGVSWSINPAVGTVANGVYTAPASISSAQIITLTATSLASSTQGASATISLTPNVSTTLSVSPAQSTLAASQTQQFSASQSSSGGLGGAASPAVQWSINPTLGSITQAGLYTAPSSITAQQNVSIIATGSNGSAQASVTLSPGQSSVQSTSIQLPLEVMGAAGTKLPVTFTIPPGSNLGGQMQLFLQIHGLKYQTQASVQVNGGTWIPINSSTATIQGYAAKLGGIGGGFTTLTFTLNLPAGSIIQGQNTVTFQFIGTNGVSSGYRVLALNVLANDGTQLIPQSTFTWDDPTTWQAPSTNPADIQAGQALWTGGSLTVPGGAAIQATCSACHTQDGADLKYFNYSNFSIQARSVFHGLTPQQGNQIASYIRTLPVAASATARPWNPPYQPGPGTDSKPVYEWAAGAGLSSVLDQDADMLAYTMPGGSTANWAYNGYMNARETPIPLQMPDWNSWLPTVHPMDAFGTTFTNSTLYTEYLNLHSALQPNSPSSYAAWAEDLRLWYDRWTALGVTPAQSDPRWSNATFAAAIHSVGQWSMVKLWEFNHEYGLEGIPTAAFGPKGTYRAWYTNMAFYTSPFMQGIPKPSPGIGNGLDVTFTYFAFIWYHVQLVLNDGNSQGSAAWPIDWPYATGYLINDLTWDADNSVPRMGTGGLYSLWAPKATQTVTNGAGTPSTMVGFPGQVSTWSEMTQSQKQEVMNADMSAWLNQYSPMTAPTFFATGIIPQSLDITQAGNDPFGMEYALPQLRYQGVDPNLLSQAANWLSGIWPNFNWTGDLNSSCWLYNLGQIFCGN